MLKILIIIPSLGTDGVTNSTISYLENMDRTDLDICLGVACGKESNVKEQIERVNALKISMHWFPNRSRETIKYSRALSMYLKKNDIDIIHVMGNSATMAVEMVIAKKCGVQKRIVHCRNTKCHYRICSFLLKPVLYHAATDFFACGSDAGRYLYGSRKFTVIPNGKEIERFLFNADNREKVRKEMNVAEKKVIGHIGTFTEQKNHVFLIDMFAELCKISDDYELWLIGKDGEKEEDTRKKVKAYGLDHKIKFLGFRTDVEKILSAIDIAVLPSLFEGLPNVVIEWQIAGLPCLLADTITEECKVLENVKFLPLNIGAEEWAKKILNIQVVSREENQKIISTKMSNAGFDIRKNAEKLKNIYLK